MEAAWHRAFKLVTRLGLGLVTTHMSRCTGKIPEHWNGREEFRVADPGKPVTQQHYAPGLSIEPTSRYSMRVTLPLSTL